MKKKTSSLLVAGLLAGALLCQQVQALPLPPGGAFATPFEPNPSPLAVLVASASAAYVGATISGTVDSFAYADPANALGGLTFVYHIIASGASADAVRGIGVDDFAGFLADASQTVGGLGTALAALGGASPSVSVERSLSGDTISFSFTPPPAGAIPPGGNSTWLVVETDAPLYTLTTAGLADGSGATATPVLAPSVPDGGLTIAFLGFALTGMGLLRRKLS